MADFVVTFEQIVHFFHENGNIVRNRDLVHHFKRHLTDPLCKDVARSQFKTIVNTIAQTRTSEDGEKFLILKNKYIDATSLDSPSTDYLSPSTSHSLSYDTLYSPPYLAESASSICVQPPPYRPPPPFLLSPGTSIVNTNFNSMCHPEDGVVSFSSQDACDNGSANCAAQNASNDVGLLEKGDDLDANEMQISVRERTQKFNKMASVDEDTASTTSPHRKSNEFKKEDIQQCDAKKYIGWCVTASKGDLQELAKLAKNEPQLVSKKDPFTAYTVLHWGAKYGNSEIIKLFAGRYKVDVNCRTSGGYTPLHLAAQFGHKDVYKLLIEVYKADPTVRDYGGKLPGHYFTTKEQNKDNSRIRKLKSRKKHIEKDLSFLRIGSLNVRVKKTTEAVSNFLGVGSISINSLGPTPENIHKSWGSADNVNDSSTMSAKAYFTKKKGKKQSDSTDSQQQSSLTNCLNDSDSDSAAGFDTHWK